jgi:hypothetical protein
VDGSTVDIGEASAETIAAAFDSDKNVKVKVQRLKAGGLHHSTQSGACIHGSFIQLTPQLNRSSTTS